MSHASLGGVGVFSFLERTKVEPEGSLLCKARSQQSHSSRAGLGRASRWMGPVCGSGSEADRLMLGNAGQTADVYTEDCIDTHQ